MSKRLFILGSTGSIGRSAVEVILNLRSLDGEGSWPVVGLSARINATLLQEQAILLQVEAASVTSGSDIDVPNLYSCSEEMLRCHAQPGDIVLVAIVGFAGISPVLTAIECGCDIALANKEALVAGGKIVMDAVSKAGVRLVPVDSEHSAICQALTTHSNNEIAKVTLTASGGSLRSFSLEEMKHATVQDVLNHPTWNMGAKVTVDSASLMNKALELVEAHWLFDVGVDRLDAVIHPQSIVHGMVEFVDGSVLAQLSPPDMKLPIQYALTCPDRVEGCSQKIDWVKQSTLQFEKIDSHRYPAIELALKVIQRGGTAGAVFNAANEVVVESFLEQSLPFGSMVAIVKEVLENISISDHVSLDSVVQADKEAREFAKVQVASHKVNF